MESINNYGSFNYTLEIFRYALSSPRIRSVLSDVILNLIVNKDDRRR